jgi:pimeloyl-ACP methyl ester carboxylesterase
MTSMAVDCASTGKISRMDSTSTDDRITEAVEDFCTPVRTIPVSSDQELERTASDFTLSNGLSGSLWGRGPRILLVHGWCGNRTHLSGFVRPLVEAGCCAVAIDCWGHGRSPGRQSHGLAFVESILRCAEEIGPFHSAIAHSLGAAATLVSMTRGLNLSSAVLLAPPEIMTVSRRFARKKGLPESQTEQFMEALEKKVKFRQGEFELHSIAPAVASPILLIHDAADREVPLDDILNLHSGCPNALLKQVSGLGHLRLLRSQEVIGAAVDFLLQTTPSSEAAILRSTGKS